MRLQWQGWCYRSWEGRRGRMRGLRWGLGWTSAIRHRLLFSAWGVLTKWFMRAWGYRIVLLAGSSRCSFALCVCTPSSADTVGTIYAKYHDMRKECTSSSPRQWTTYRWLLLSSMCSLLPYCWCGWWGKELGSTKVHSCVEARSDR